MKVFIVIREKYMKLKLIRLVLLVYIIVNTLMPISVLAESPQKETFETLSIDEGLSNEYITSIFQDSKGYMWIGTKDGLNRYDGERIIIYNCSTNTEKSLSSTYINDIEEDSKGNIWVATDSGLDIINVNKDTKDVNINGICVIATVDITSINDFLLFLFKTNTIIEYTSIPNAGANILSNTLNILANTLENPQ